MAEQVLPDAPVYDSATELAVARTRAAYERTMMSWIRTATSLITFGFTIYKFFQIEAPPRAPVRFIGPRDFAAMLVSIGLVTLLLGMLEYRQNIRALGGAARRQATLACGDYGGPCLYRRNPWAARGDLSTIVVHLAELRSWIA